MDNPDIKFLKIEFYKNFTFMLLCIVKYFFLNNQADALIILILF